MTDEELKDLVAENSRAIRGMREVTAETSRIVAENSRAIRENNRAIRELREVTAETSRIVAENNRAIRELREETREETLATRREMDRQFTGIHRELGALGNSLGLYTESMFSCCRAFHAKGSPGGKVPRRSSSASCSRGSAPSGSP